MASNVQRASSASLLKDGVSFGASVGTGVVVIVCSMSVSGAGAVVAVVPLVPGFVHALTLGRAVVAGLLSPMIGFVA